MKPNLQKIFDFTTTLCPSRKFKRAAYFKADWEILEPMEQQGKHLIVSRYDSKSNITIKLFNPQSKDKRIKQPTIELEPTQSGEFYLNNRKLSIVKIEEGMITMYGYFDHPLKLKKIKLVGES